MTLPAPRPDRTCLVTGASSGIGHEIADLLASRGYGVTVVARRAQVLEELATDLASRYGVRAQAIPCDLTDEASRASLATQLADRSLAVSVLVNDAGLSTMGPVHRSDPGAELTMVRVDVEAVVHLCSLFLPGMVERRSGAVLNVASTSAFQPVPGQAGYGASKAFVLAYTQAVRTELRPTGVTMTALCPGPVATGFLQAAGVSEDQAAQSLPKVLWMPVRDVAAAGIAGLDADKAVVVPGIANRLAAAASWYTPRSVLLPILARRHPALRPDPSRPVSRTGDEVSG